MKHHKWWTTGSSHCQCSYHEKIRTPFRTLFINSEVWGIKHLQQNISTNQIKKEAIHSKISNIWKIRILFHMSQVLSSTLAEQTLILKGMHCSSTSYDNISWSDWWHCTLEELGFCNNVPAQPASSQMQMTEHATGGISLIRSTIVTSQGEKMAKVLTI